MVFLVVKADTMLMFGLDCKINTLTFKCGLCWTFLIQCPNPFHGGGKAWLQCNFISERTVWPAGMRLSIEQDRGVVSFCSYLVCNPCLGVVI